jgi:hypothetical protein
MTNKTIESKVAGSTVADVPESMPQASGFLHDKAASGIVKRISAGSTPMFNRLNTNGCELWSCGKVRVLHLMFAARKGGPGLRAKSFSI